MASQPDLNKVADSCPIPTDPKQKSAMRRGEASGADHALVSLSKFGSPELLEQEMIGRGSSLLDADLLPAVEITPKNRVKDTVGRIERVMTRSEVAKRSVSNVGERNKEKVTEAVVQPSAKKVEENAEVAKRSGLKLRFKVPKVAGDGKKLKEPNAGEPNNEKVTVVEPSSAKKVEPSNVGVVTKPNAEVAKRSVSNVGDHNKEKVAEAVVEPSVKKPIPDADAKKVEENAREGSVYTKLSAAEKKAVRKYRKWLAKCWSLCAKYECEMSDLLS